MEPNDKLAEQETSAVEFEEMPKEVQEEKTEEQVLHEELHEEAEESSAPVFAMQEPDSDEIEADSNWAPTSANYYYALSSKQVREEKTNNTGKVLSAIACFLVFALVFSLTCVITSGLFSNAIQNGKFSFGNRSESGSGVRPSEDLTTIADIAADVKCSIVQVFPAATSFGAEETYGTGLLVGEQGNMLYILTCYHLLEKSSEVSIRFPDSNTNYKATLRGFDIETDLCVLYVYKDRLPAEQLVKLKLCTVGDSDLLAAGDLAIVVGNPSSLDYANSVTSGVIGAANRTISKINEEQTSGVTYTLIQTDAAINPGDSGAPLLNGRGEVIGICNHYVDDVDGEGMNFALAINKAVPVIEAIISTGHMPRPYLGIVGYSVSDWSYSEMFGLTHGAVVSGITPGGPADQAGIQVYDCIVSFAGVEVKDFDEVKAVLANYDVGDTLDLIVYRFYQKEEPEYVTLHFTLLDKYAEKE